MKTKRAERGNILFLILLAVVLFAALSYAITSSMRGGGKDVTQEAAQATASEILNYATLMEQTEKRLRLVSDCKLNEISFENPIVSGYTSNYARADKKCNIFDTNGGGMAWKSAPTKWLEETSVAASYTGGGVSYGNFVFPPNVCVRYIGASDCSPSNNRHLMVGLFYLKKSICDAINERFGYTTNTPAEACTPAGLSGQYQGDFGTGGSVGKCSNANGKATACVYSTQTGYTFYHVLEAQ